MSENRMLRSARGGFTLVELMIVVIILSILAAIIVPQFVSSTDDAKNSALESTLANMRAAIDFYYQQHGEYPAAHKAADGTPASPPTDTDFIDQLSLYTNDEGQTSPTKTDVFKYGPYLRKRVLPPDPKSPNGTVNALEVINVGNLDTFVASGTDGGWKYDAKTGQFIANHTAYDHL